MRYLRFSDDMLAFGVVKEQRSVKRVQARFKIFLDSFVTDQTAEKLAHAGFGLIPPLH